MTEISIQKQPAALTGLEECESFGKPVGALPLQTNAGFFEGELAKGQLYTGKWECEPGTLELDLELTEFCYLLEGHWRFTSERTWSRRSKQAIAGSSQKAGKALPR